MKSVSHPVKNKKFKTVQDIVHSQDFVVVVAFFVLIEKLYNKTIPPRSILVFSGRYHIMSNASIVNNCILRTLN